MSYSIKDLNHIQRDEMIMLGFNPLNSNHIEYYLNGGRKPTQEMLIETINRMGGTRLNMKPSKNYKVEKEVDGNSLLGMDIDSASSIARSSGSNVKDVMSNYGKFRNENIQPNRFDKPKKDLYESHNSEIDPVTERNAEQFFIKLNGILKSRSNYKEWLELFNSLKTMLVDINGSNNKENKVRTLEDIKNEFVNSL